jgi:hypothetical protein
MDNRKRFIVRISRKQFALRYADHEAEAVWCTVWNLDMENRKQVLVQCYEYQPDTDSAVADWEGPLFSDDHTRPPFEPNWVVRHGQKAESLTNGITELRDSQVLNEVGQSG